VQIAQTPFTPYYRVYSDARHPGPPVCISKPVLPTLRRWLFRLACTPKCARRSGHRQKTWTFGISLLQGEVRCHPFTRPDSLCAHKTPHLHFADCRLLLQHELATADETDDSHRPFESIQSTVARCIALRGLLYPESALTVAGYSHRLLMIGTVRSIQGLAGRAGALPERRRRILKPSHRRMQAALSRNIRHGCVVNPVMADQPCPKVCDAFLAVYQVRARGTRCLSIASSVIDFRPL
jgi:hypothetical protein